MLPFGTFSHTMICILFKLSLDTDGAMYLAFAYDIPKPQHEASREGTIIPYPDGKRLSASLFP